MAKREYYTLNTFARFRPHPPESVFKYFGDDPLIDPEAFRQMLEARMAKLEQMRSRGSVTKRNLPDTLILPVDESDGSDGPPTPSTS